MKELLYDWGGANVWLFYALNSWHNDVLNAVMRFGTALGDHERFALYIALLALIAWARAKRGAMQPWLPALAVFAVAYVLDGFLVGWLKHALDFPRPLGALPPETVYVVGTPEYHHSLPSGHSVFAATCVASLWPLFTRGGKVTAAMFVVWVMLSRIYLGFHFPTDVIAGATLGVVVVVGVRLLCETFMRTGIDRHITQVMPRLFPKRKRGKS